MGDSDPAAYLGGLMLTVTIKAQGLDETAKILDKYKHLLPQAVVRGAEAVALMHARYTINSKLTEANPPFLNQQTGALAYSVAASIHKERATLVGEKVTATYGTDKDYGAKHEFGGTFTEKVREHVRRVTSRNVIANRKNIASGFTFVRAHTRTRTYRARRMFQTALADLSNKAALPLDRSIETLLRHHRLASQNEMLAGTPGQQPARIRR